MGELIRLHDRRQPVTPRPVTSRPATPRPVTPLPVTPRPAEPLWREVVGRRLRVLRRARGERLADVAARAGMSPQYLSELERGRKDPSSEMLAAVAGALATSLLEVLRLAHDDLDRHARARGAGPRGPVLLAA